MGLVAGCSGGSSNNNTDGGQSFDWPECPQIQNEQSLAEKAAYFDQVVRDQHLTGDGLLRNITLTEDLASVETWHHVENVILWSGMYLASQAFRYSVTGQAEAQENAKIVVAALRELTDVTGVKGLYGRSFSKPGVAYNYDGSGTTSWTESPSQNHQGWWYRNDVSKDGFAGLMFGYSAAFDHFDDPQLVADVKQLLSEIGEHLIDNGLQIIGADGIVTEHGALYHSAFDDYPGFNALLATSFIKTIQVATADQDIDDFYYGCLMRTRSGVDCPDIEVSEIGSYIESMENLLSLFLPNCKQNYDNFDMCYQAIYPLLSREQEPELRQRLLGVLRNNMFHTDNPDHQSIAEIGNSFFTFCYAVLIGDGPDDDPVLKAAVDHAVCKLKEFPAKKIHRYIPAGSQTEVCRTRLDDPAAAETIPLAEYHFDNYLWRLDFFEIQEERAENQRHIYSPEDYLVAYWLGRYHGLLGPDL
jgi:hypothetical protein